MRIGPKYSLKGDLFMSDSEREPYNASTIARQLRVMEQLGPRGGSYYIDPYDPFFPVKEVGPLGAQGRRTHSLRELRDMAETWPTVRRFPE